MGKRCETDWFRLICDLKKVDEYYSHKKISEITNIPVGTLSGLKSGAEPKHADGDKLVRLWCFVTGGERKDLPKVGRFSYHG